MLAHRLPQIPNHPTAPLYTIAVDFASEFGDIPELLVSSKTAFDCDKKAYVMLPQIQVMQGNIPDANVGMMFLIS